MSEYLVNLASGKTDEKGIFRFLGKLYNQSGVIESTALTVSAQSTPDMTVKVSGSTNADSVAFMTTNGDFYGGWNTFPYNVTIPSNSSGVTKYDNVIAYAYADTAAGSSTANNPGGLKFLAVRGNINPYTFPTDAEINATISNKPFLRLKDVTVGNGVSSINSGNLTNAPAQAAIPTSRLATITTGKTTDWSPGASVNTTTSTSFVQIGGYSDTFTFSGGPFQVMLSIGNFSNAGGNVRFGIRIGATDTEVVPSVPTTGHALAATAFFPAGTASGLQTYKPIYSNGNGVAVTVPAYASIKCSIIDWGK